MKFNRAAPYLVFCLLVSVFANAARTDTVYLYNGDRITGEIKYMHQNKLSFKTDRAGTMSIEWPSVAKIYSANYFDIVLATEERVFGSLHFADSIGKVIIKLGNDRVEKSINQIVSIDAVKAKFFDQLSGQISLSANYAKANSNLQVNGSFDITHRGQKLVNNISASTVITSAENTDQAERSDASYSIYFLQNSRTFTIVSVVYEKNTELNINARYLINAGPGMYFIRKPFEEFYGLVGLAGTREQSIAEPVTETNNLEFLVQSSYHRFKFRNPQLDILAGATGYVSLTDWGRFRANFEIQLLWELFNDFKLNLTFYDNYDNKQAGTGGSNNDWSILTGISYTL